MLDMFIILYTIGFFFSFGVSYRILVISNKLEKLIKCFILGIGSWYFMLLLLVFGSSDD